MGERDFFPKPFCLRGRAWDGGAVLVLPGGFGEQGREVEIQQVWKSSAGQLFSECRTWQQLLEPSCPTVLQWAHGCPEYPLRRCSQPCEPGCLSQRVTQFTPKPEAEQREHPIPEHPTPTASPTRLLTFPIPHSL